MTRAYNQPPTSWWRAWRWRLLTLTVVAAGLATLYSPLFTIKNVIVDNAPSYQTEQRITAIVESLMQPKGITLLPQSNLIFFSAAAGKQAVTREFYIQGLEFKRQWPNILRITAPQDTVVALWKADRVSYLVNGHGTLVQELADEPPPANLIAVTEAKPLTHQLGDQVAPELTMQFLKNLGLTWSQQLMKYPLAYVSFDPAALPTLQATTQTGWYVLVSVEQDLSTQVEATRRLLEEKIKDDQTKLEYIDVRFGSRLYYKLR